MAVNNEPLIPSPLQRFRLLPSEYALIGYARSVIIRRCMGRQGFEYPTRSWHQVLQATVENERVAIGRIYGITNPDSAAVHGYGFPPTEPLGETDMQVRRDISYRVALYGDAADPGGVGATMVNIGGCAGDADRRLENDDTTLSTYGLAHTLWIESMGELLKSDRYRTIVRPWRTCMRARGFRVTDPLEDAGAIRDALDSRQRRGDTDLTSAPDAAEIAIAQADVSCKRSTRLVSRLNAAAAVLARRVISDNRRALQADLHRLRRQVSTAAEEVGEPRK